MHSAIGTSKRDGKPHLIYLSITRLVLLSVRDTWPLSDTRHLDSWLATFHVGKQCFIFQLFRKAKTYSRVRAEWEWELTVTCEVRRGHVLDGDLLQEGWFLAARVPAHHPGLLQPLTEPGQVTVAHIRVGQEVTVKIKERQREGGH